MGCCIDNSYSYFSEQLAVIEEKAHQPGLSLETRDALHEALNEVYTGIQDIELQSVHVNLFARSFLEEIKAKMVSLFGEIDDLYVKAEIEWIKTEAETMPALFQPKTMGELARAVDALKTRINTLFTLYLPGLEERKVIAFAQLMVQKAEDFLSGKPECLDAPTIWDDVTVGEVLQEIATYLSQDDKTGARFAFNRLNNAQKKLILAYLPPHDLLDTLFHETELLA